MELTITPAGYRFTRLPGNAIRVKSPKGQVYIVEMLGRSCSCPGFVFTGKCKHIRAVLGMLELCGGWFETAEDFIEEDRCSTAHPDAERDREARNSGMDT